MIVVSSAVSASEDTAKIPSIKFFQMNSLKAIEEKYEYNDFILVLWSLECPPCYKELKLLSRWWKNNPNLKLVLVSTDSPDQIDAVKNFLDENRLIDGDNWAFSNASTMKLRYSIDPQWYGELPRSYFYQANKPRQAVSGILTEQHLKQWAALSQASL